MSQPKVTIIILHWHLYDYTYQCLASLAGLTYSNWQVLVVDNGSHDGSLERLCKVFPWIQMLEYASNQGFAAGVNPAIRRALQSETEYVFLLNNDVVVEPDVLTRMITAAEAYPAIGVWSPKIVCEGRADHLAGLGCRIRALDIEMVGWDTPDMPQAGEEPVVLDCVFATAMLLSRPVIETVGLFDERFFFYYEDFDYCLRVRAVGLLSAYLPQVVVSHAIAASVRRIPGLRDFYLARSRQLFFRKYRNGLTLAAYMTREAIQVLRAARMRLKERRPSAALGYVAGALVGLVMRNET